jgi:hypothetical protein
MTLAFTDTDVARFYRYVEKLPSGCWFWSGARSRGKGNRKFYGSFRLGNRTVRAHRFACEAIGGRDCPPEHDRDHTCEFSLCVNPDHIEVVPKTVNQARKIERRAVRLGDPKKTRGIAALKRAVERRYPKRRTR